MNTFVTKKLTIGQKRTQSRKWLVSASGRAGLIVLFVGLGFLYLFQANSVSSKGFAIADLERKVTLLERETKQLDAEIAEHRSLKSINTRLTEMNMVGVGPEVSYVTDAGSAVALR